jgi:T-complex protein 1 subunit alpha
MGLTMSLIARIFVCVVTGRFGVIDVGLMADCLRVAGVQILVSDPGKMEEIMKREADITKEKIQKILAAGANVIITTRGIDDLCMKYLVEAGVIGIRRVSNGGGLLVLFRCSRLLMFHGVQFVSLNSDLRSTCVCR